ncbi:MAG: flagellar basal body-associated FliL family protein [Pseudobdellovibrionaceae bacterium]
MSENLTKGQSPAVKSSSASEQDAEDAAIDIDGALAELEPEFASSLEDIKNNEFPKELPDLENISIKVSFLKRIKLSTVLLARKFKFIIIHWVLFKIPAALIAIKKATVDFFHVVSEKQRQFRYLSTKQKLVIVGFSLFAFLSLILAIFILWRGFIPEPKELFLSSLDEWSENKYFYDRKKDQESFYDSWRLTPYIVEIPKMTVNIIASPSSGDNPMASFDFYVEGLSADVLIEIKDRLAEIKDLFQRTMEEMTYDQLASPEGKQQLCNRLKKEVNRHLTSGQVRRVLIKTVVLKP